jgi:hypothetical protein
VSAAYLQRLLDRAAALPAAPARQVMPAGATLSPVAAADQRLHDPALAAQFGFLPGDADAAAAGEFSGAEMGAAPVQAVPFRADSRAAPAGQPPDVAAPSRPAARPASPPPVGHVFAADFLPTEDAAPAPATPVPSPAATAQDVRPPAPLSPTSTAAVPAVTLTTVGLPPVVRETVSEGTPAREPAPVAWPQAPRWETRPLEPVPAMPAPGEMRPIAPAPPPLPAPYAAPARASPVPVRPEAQPIPPAPEPPRGNTRPAMAAEASIIGPLSPRPRAVTLFGLRRR